MQTGTRPALTRRLPSSPRWARELVLALLVVLGLWLTVAPHDGGTRAVQLLLAAAAVAGVVLSDRAPGWGTLVAATATVGAWAVGATADPFVLTGFALFRWANIRGTRRFPWWMLASAAVVLIGAAVLGGDAVSGGIRLLLLSGVVLSAAWMLGVRTRESELAAATRSRTEERLRLARDVHDVLSHSLGSIGVRAGVAAHVESLGVSELRDTLREIESDARSSLGDLRDLLHRERGGDADAVVPMLSVALADIARDAKRGGVTVSLDSDPAVDALPVAVRTTALRIVREAVTNIIRHAAPTSAAVTLCVRSDRLQVRVADTGGAAPAGIRAGNGLIGMRERAELIGGSVDWIVTATGVTIVADLPCAPAAEDR